MVYCRFSGGMGSLGNGMGISGGLGGGLSGGLTGGMGLDGAMDMINSNQLLLLSRH